MDRLKPQDLSILLVEPSNVQQKIIMNCLQNAQVNHVEVEDSGKKALQKMQSYVPDLLISAMYFQDMTSTELAGRMRDDERLKTVPFMLISSEDKDYKLDPLKQLGVIAILPKPFRKQDLELALNSTIAYLEPEELDFQDFHIEELNVLLVDDSRSARRYIKKILSDMGMKKITEAENGVVAVDKLSEQVFDLIVSDYNMPEMDGAQLLNYIRQESSQSSVPVLMVTSESDSAKISSVKQSGVSAICDKPFDVNHVKGLLMNILD